MTARRFEPGTWPLTLKVPVLVAVLIVAVTAVTSSMALKRLSDNQKTHLSQLTGAYLDGLSTAVMPHVIREDTWETFDILDRARWRYEGVHARYTIVALNNGAVLASSEPRAFPSLSQVPPDLIERFPNGESLVIDDDASRAWLYRMLKAGNLPVGSLFAEIDITDLLRERHEVLVALLRLLGLMTLVLVAIGYLLVRRMVRPVSVLTAHVEHAREGKVELIPQERLPHQGTEFGLLFRRFNAMARALNEREALSGRLAEEERLAQLGKLASGMAHEVNNPLGGLMNTVDTLRKHGGDRDVFEASLDLLRRGLTDIRNVVRAILVTYKGVTELRPLIRSDFDDLKFLVQHEVGRRHLRLVWDNGLPEAVPVDGPATRQAALNLLLNACAASPVGGVVEVAARLQGGAVRISFADDGPGLPEPVAALFRAPSDEALPAKGSTGLGAWTAARLVARMNGRFDMDTAPRNGTRLTIVVPVAREKRLDAVA